MAINGVEIKVGQVWRSRNGSQWEIIGPYEGGDWTWLAEQIGGASVGSETNFSEDGLFWPKTSGLNKGPHESDLMFLVSDPDVKPERRKQQEPNSPLRRQDDTIPVPETVPDLAASPADFAASVPGMLDALREDDTAHMPAAVSALLDHPEIAPFSKPQSALDVQIGGDHYRSMAIQPVTYIESNGLDFLAGNVVKYVSRHKNKNGSADVRKAIHYCQLILELQYGEKQ